MRSLLRFLLTVLSAAPALTAQDRRELEVRAFLHDPVRPVVVFRYPDKSGGPKPLPLMAEGLSAPCVAVLADDELVLQGEDGAVAARVKVPPAFKRAAVIVIPAAKADDKPPYRMIVVDDDPASFPWGSSRVISLLGVETALQAGEHKLALPAGKITPLPAVTKVDEFNMAQVNFHYREGTRWLPFTERRMQFTGEVRRLFLVHVTPGSKRPFVATITDYPPAAVPR